MPPLLALVALLAAFGQAPANGAEARTVAILPTSCFRAAPGNSAVFDAAFRTSLTRRGFRVLDAAPVKEALAAEKIELPRHVSFARAAAVGRRAGADLTVYARLLGVGAAPPLQNPVVDPARMKLVLIVAVIDSKSGRGRHVYQVEHLYTSPDPGAPQQLVPREAAEAAVEAVMQGFYQRQR